MRMQCDWKRAGFATVAAFSLTAGTYWLLGATPKDAQPPTVAINEPALLLDGCRVKIRLAPDTPDLKKIVTTGYTIQPGPLPQFQMEASNPGIAPTTIQFTANLRISDVPEEHARLVPLQPAPTWHQEFTLILKPGQTLQVPLNTGATIKSMQLARMSLENGTQQVFPMELNTGSRSDNVAFADTHVEFTTSPYVGQSGDNIWTINSATTQPALIPAAPAQPVVKQVAAKTGQ